MRSTRRPTFRTTDGDNDIFPKQGPSVQLQVTQLKFQSLARPVKLWVDASPGCGGIAWPAGQVCALLQGTARALSAAARSGSVAVPAEHAIGLAQGQAHRRARLGHWARWARCWHAGRSGHRHRSGVRALFLCYPSLTACRSPLLSLMQRNVTLNIPRQYRSRR